jgi:hypothetical protein
MPPSELFKKFDGNSDDQLSKEEFEKAMMFVRDHAPIGPPRRPGDGPRFGPPGGPGDGPGEGRGDGPRRSRRDGERGRRRPAADGDSAASAPDQPKAEASAVESDAKT